MRWGVAVASCAMIAASCVSDDSTTPPVDSGVDSGIDSGAPADAAGDTCSTACSDATTLHVCGQSDETCALGCVATGTPHCAVMQPASPLTVADLSASGVGDLVLNQSVVIHTDTGAIDGIRAANADPTTNEVVSNIGFRLVSGAGVGVFTVQGFTIKSNVVVVARGSVALAIAASGAVSIQGTLDARGYTSNGLLCGTAAPSAVGPGGTAAGQFTGEPGAGAGGGNGADIGGGGGGGFGGDGGDGQHSGSESAPNSVGGPNVAFALPIAGGFGGGTSGGGSGGGGGGAVQIASPISITVGGGTSPGGINAGGCGGFGNTNPNFPGQGGGGGGSGGEILLQSPVVAVTANGIVAANGGAGGSGGGFGAAGLLSDQAAPPTASVQAPGGAGGAGASLAGVSAPGAANTLGGGGGGAVGRIRVDDATGALTLPNGALVSPSLGSAAATAVKLTAN